MCLKIGFHALACEAIFEMPSIRKHILGLFVSAVNSPTHRTRECAKTLFHMFAMLDKGKKPSTFPEKVASASNLRVIEWELVVWYSHKEKANRRVNIVFQTRYQSLDHSLLCVHFVFQGVACVE